MSKQSPVDLESKKTPILGVDAHGERALWTRLLAVEDNVTNQLSIIRQADRDRQAVFFNEHWEPLKQAMSRTKRAAWFAVGVSSATLIIAATLIVIAFIALR